MKPRQRADKVVLSRIYVDKLFGDYSYDLELGSEVDEALLRLLILYGDNGSGKTTLLKLVFSLLASDEGRGHKTFVANTLFSEFKVEFSNGTSVVASRPKDTLLGGFSMSVLKKGKIISKLDWKADDRLRCLGEMQDKPRMRHLFQSLSKLEIDLYFLSDDRSMVTSKGSSDNARYEDTPPRRHSTARGLEKKGRLQSRDWRKSATSLAQGQILEATLRRVQAWATERTLEGSTKGEADANALYADIIIRLASPIRGKTSIHAQLSKDKLISELQAQANRSVAFSQFGLIGPMGVEPVISSLRAADPAMQETLRNILVPYIDSVKARLNALEPVHSAVNSFLSILNGYYRNKTITFDLQNGISLMTGNGAPIPPSVLSSGERHLLLLFCNILVAKGHSSIFIIDEPELSLNVKWQRGLLDKLLEFTKESSVQFVLATHSIELLSHHTRNVLKLIDVARSK
jgi:energy-coupling factor transporter ATP-binding protein EcfA2